ncbi:MAG: MarR family transcriptional regulator, partial [Oscillochloris sp.]|nr:MarR family transcriptional regulator [Oscillochloris sp.]
RSRLFLKLHRLFQELNREEFRPYDLSTPQYAILFHASEAGVPLSTICQAMLADNSNLTRMVDRLEARGLVRRAPDRSDRRVTLVQLTPEGKMLIDVLRPRHRDHVEERMRLLSDEQLDAFHHAMQTLYEHLHEQS